MNVRRVWWLGFDWIAASNGLIGGHANNPRAKPGISNGTLHNVQPHRSPAGELDIYTDPTVVWQGRAALVGRKFQHFPARRVCSLTLCQFPLYHFLVDFKRDSHKSQ